MRRRRIAFLAPSLAIAACGAPQPAEILTVTFVDPRIDALNGQRISVAGYLGDCMGYDCSLYATKEQHDLFKRWIATARAAERTVPRPDIPSLAIGSGLDGDFDKQGTPFSRSYVIITGTVTNKCRFNGEPACADRGTDIEPEDIRAGKAPPPPS
jgi:hypothetical protein